jgi:hypothetical protein
MTRFCSRQVRLPALALVLSVFLLVPPMVAAQAVEQPCGDDVPSDNYQSQGVGLTVPELTALYGPHGFGQGSIYFDMDGVELHKANCDLILVFPQDGSVEPVDETALAESLLPPDAELVGNFTLGPAFEYIEDNTLWRSQSLADRFASMDVNRGGEILIVYTYEQMGRVLISVQLRTLKLPE